MDKPRTWFIVDGDDLSASYMYRERSIEVVSLDDYEALKATLEHAELGRTLAHQEAERRLNEWSKSQGDFEALKADRDSLREQLAQSEARIESRSSLLAAQADDWVDFNELKADRDRLFEALQKYATNDFDAEYDCSSGECGQIAREALAEGETNEHS